MIMKNKGLFLLILFFLITFNFNIVLGNEPNIDILEEDVGKIQSLVEDGINIYNPETNEINKDKLDSYFPKTKFEEKIIEFNQMFDEANNSWAPFLFGMKIELSLVFILNLYFILLFLVIFIFDIKKIFFMFNFNKLIFFLFGFSIFIVFLFTRLNLALARYFTELILFIWAKVIPIGFIVAIIFAIILILLFIFSPKIMLIITKKLNELKKKRDEKKREERINKNVQLAENKTQIIGEVSDKLTSSLDINNLDKKE